MRPNYRVFDPLKRLWGIARGKTWAKHPFKTRDARVEFLLSVNEEDNLDEYCRYLVCFSGGWEIGGRPVLFVDPSVYQILKHSQFDVLASEFPELGPYAAGNCLSISLPDGTACMLASFISFDGSTYVFSYIDATSLTKVSEANWNKTLAGSSNIENLDSITLVLRLFVYLKAFPECLVPGLSQVGGSVNVRQGEYKCSAVTKTASIRHVDATFLRSGHFRALRHERFTRNEDGSVRIVYVRPTVVNGKEIDATTVELADQLEGMVLEEAL
jgi:hypothetical protein